MAYVEIERKTVNNIVAGLSMLRDQLYEGKATSICQRDNTIKEYYSLRIAEVEATIAIYEVVKNNPVNTILIK